MKTILKIILIVINLLLIVMLLLSTLAGKVEPSKFIGFSLLSYLYLYLLIANVLFILVWLLFGSKWFLLSLVGILIRFSFIPLYFQIGGTESLSQEERAEASSIKVMTFNVHLFNGTDVSYEVVDTNMKGFLSIVDEESPDLLALQEYIGQGMTVNLTEKLRERGYTYVVSGYDSGSITGEVIFSKLPIQRVVRIEGPSKLYANLLWGDDTLRLYCLHLSSYGLDESDHKHLSEIYHGEVPYGQLSPHDGTLRKFRRTIVRHEQEWQTLKPYFESKERMTLVAGDFNETPASYFYQQICQFFKDSYCESGQGFSTTYHGLLTRQRNTTFPAFRIDMVLHSPDMEAVAYKRIKSDISDHHPVVVEIKKKK